MEIYNDNTIYFDPSAKGCYYAFDLGFEKELVQLNPDHTEDFRICADHDKRTLTLVPCAPGAIIEIGPQKTETLGKIIKDLVQIWEEREERIQKMSRKNPQNDKIQTGLRVPADQYDRLLASSNRMGISLNALILVLIDIGLNRLEMEQGG